MIRKKRKTEIKEALNRLNKTDVYSMLLFIIYKMREIPEYSTLSELIYVMDKDNLVKFVSFFSGTTIKVPTLDELRLVTQAMLLYQYVNLDNGDLQEGLEVICDKNYKKEDLLEVYMNIVSIASNYEFERN